MSFLFILVAVAGFLSYVAITVWLFMDCQFKGHNLAGAFLLVLLFSVEIWFFYGVTR
jgi:hypothetical protein